jgi:phage-related protein
VAQKHRRQWRDYKTPAGARPVKELLAKLTDEELAAIAAGMRDVRERGTAAARHLRGEIYEVRADAATRSYRLLFSCEGKYSHVLLSLSIYEKRSQKAPTKEIDLAEKRKKAWRARAEN